MDVKEAVEVDMEVVGVEEVAAEEKEAVVVVEVAEDGDGDAVNLKHCHLYPFFTLSLLYLLQISQKKPEKII